MTKSILLLLVLVLLFAGCKKKDIVELGPPPILTDSSMVAVSTDFEQELIRQRIDKSGNADGLVRYGDVSQIDSLFIYGSHLIKSLKGIEHFTKLRSLT